MSNYNEQGNLQKKEFNLVYGSLEQESIMVVTEWKQTAGTEGQAEDSHLELQKEKRERIQCRARP